MAITFAKLLPRVVTALVMLSLVLTLVWVEPLRPGFALLVGLLAVVGLYEYYALVRARAISPETIGGMVAGTLIALSGWFADTGLTSLMLYGGSVLVAALHVVRGQHSVAGLATSVFGIFYVGWFGAHFIFLENDPELGPEWVMVLLVAVALTDTGAYFVGSAIGRHKMAPHISPNKTWEGAAGGLAAALIGMAAVHYIGRLSDTPAFPDWTLVKMLVAGALLSVTSQVGDLAESCLKRDANVKDSGNLFPGHGGVLDRCDGYLFAAPVLYYLVHAWTA